MSKRKRKRNIRERDIDELSELMNMNWHRERRYLEILL